MQTVCELHSFRRAASDAGMAEDEVRQLIDYLARNPSAGEEIVGTGGCRKVRVAGRGKGKSGGYRVITFYSGTGMPLFLLTVFSKGQRSDLAEGEKQKLAAMTRELVAQYRGGAGAGRQ